MNLNPCMVGDYLDSTQDTVPSGDETQSSGIVILRLCNVLAIRCN